MNPKRFSYYAPSTLREAIELLQRYQENAKILAGGQSLVPAMKFRIASPEVIIDINRIKDLTYIAMKNNGFICIGALTRHNEVASSSLVASYAPALIDAARVIGDRLVRNRGTIGGSACHADPSADYPPVLLALDAELIATGPTGTRSIKAADFFHDAYTTALRPEEVLTEIRIPISRGRATSSYYKFERIAGDFSIVGAAVYLSVDSSSKCIEARVALGGVERRPLRSPSVEKALKGIEMNGDLKKIADAAKRCTEDVKDPLGDIRASPEYRRALSSVVCQRALEIAVSRITSK